MITERNSRRLRIFADEDEQTVDEKARVLQFLHVL